MLQEMEDAILAPRFLPATYAKPKSDRDAFDVWHVRHRELCSLIESFLAENHA